MSILSAQRLAKSYGAQDVLTAIDLEIARGDKIGLVGANGAGKTTLLRLLLGLEEPSAGEIHRARGLCIGYLPQKPEFPSQQTLYDEMLAVFAPLRAQQRALLALAEELANHPASAELLQRYAETEQRFELAGGYTYEHRIQRVLGGLGFGPETYAWPIAKLSGGQVTRALLAKLLLQEPDLLVLDEPTNYLDLEALEWLEGYLQEWPQSLLVVSHDRRFLDRVVSRIWELEGGRLEKYRGNYSQYLLQRQQRRERLRREYEEQQELIARTEEFVRRYKAGQRSKEARGRETRLKRLERIAAPQEQRQLHVQMSPTLRSGDHVLLSDGVTIGYPVGPGEHAEKTGPHVLLRTGPLLIQRGQRVALLGPNGSGKTTFLRTVLGQIPPLEGHLRLGASVRVGYLSQTQESLDPAKTVLEQVLGESAITPEEARHLLARFLFCGDEVFKPIGALSGGERSRVALALLTLRGANFLLLDEPTTHLDLAAQEVLQNVLADFRGTILFVSHDRYLVDALATHVWAIHEGQLRQFEGNYSAYVQALEAEANPRVKTDPGPSAQEWEARRRQERQRKRLARRWAERIAFLEQEIARLEQELRILGQDIERASAAQDVARLQRLSQSFQEAESALAERMAEWEEQMSLAQGEALAEALTPDECPQDAQ